jgi:LytS/YehU family sensor histidine kinase
MVSFIWNYKTNKQSETQRLADNEQLLRDAELLDLRQQIQPHFLFNSLNSISALLVTKPNSAQKMIQELAAFLRGTLKKENNGLVTLAAELNHLQLYLNIEMVRFGHRLKVENNIDANTENRSLPTLLLQPIVENAIKFGLYGTTEQITIHITSKIQNDMLFIEITNPYDIEAHYANKGAGFGLNSIARRLYLLFGRNDLLKIHTKENIFITQILIPLQTA